MTDGLVIIKGAGDIATGVAHRLFQCGFRILLLEVSEPTAIRRTVAFAEAVYGGQVRVEGVTAALAENLDLVEPILAENHIPVLIDPEGYAIQRFRPLVVVDAILAKRNLGTSVLDAPMTIGLGPGFKAGENVRAVIETQRGHDLGKVIYQGEAAPNTGNPGEIGGYTVERLLRAPKEGIFRGFKSIASEVSCGEVLAKVGDEEIKAPINGILRGILKDGLYVSKGFKLGDIDPRGQKEHCFTISDKARAIAGGVLEAILHFKRKEE